METPHKSFENDKSFQALYDQSLHKVVVDHNKSFDLLSGITYFFEFVVICSIFFSFDNIPNTVIALIGIHLFFVIVGGIGFVLYRKNFKISHALQKYNDVIIICFLCITYILKLEVFFDMERIKSIYFILGMTILPIMMLSEGFIAKLYMRLTLLVVICFYIIIRVIFWDRANLFLILQIINIGICTFYAIRRKEQEIKMLCQQISLPNEIQEAQEDALPNILRVLPNNVFLFGNDLEVLFTNSNQINRSATDNFPNTEKVDHFFEDDPFQKSDLKISSLKLIKELEVISDEESINKLFSAIVSSAPTNYEDSVVESLKNSHTSPKSSRSLLAAPVNNLLHSRMDLESLGHSITNKGNLKKVRSWIQSVSLFQVLEMISKNTGKFHELFGKPFSSIILSGKLLEKHFLTRTFTEPSRSLTKQSSDPKFVDIKITPISYKNQNAIFVIVSEKKNPDFLPQKNKNEYKINLLASFSHELRTPLNGNLNFLEAAIQHPDITEEVKREFLAPALASAKLLFYIISDILDYSQFSLNKISLSIKRFHIKTLLDDIIELFEAQAEKKNLKITFNIVKDFEFATDFTRLTQVLINLMSNAIKFTYEGMIQISVTKVSDPLNCHKISVKDTGIGISEKERKKIEKILRGEDTEKVGNQSVGSNLGLTTASKLATLLGPAKGGGITIEDELKGTKLSFLVENKELPSDHRSLIDLSLSGLLEPNSQLPDDQFIRSKQPRSYTFTNASPEKDEGIVLIEKASTSNVRALKELKLKLKDESHSLITTPEEATPESVGQYNLAAGMMNLKKNNEIAKSMLKRNGDRSLSKFSLLKDNTKCKCSSTVLIVDDDSFNVMAAEKLFGQAGLECVSVFNGKQAIEVLESRKKCAENCPLFRFIIMDCNMPVMDGYEASTYLKSRMKNSDLPKIPIIACTAFVTQFDSAKCFDSGMDDYVSKPLSKEKIHRILEKWGKNFRMDCAIPIHISEIKSNEELEDKLV